jgi:hypothetical protein
MTTKAALSLLALLLLAPHVSAQESIALAVEGWSTETRNDITYYRCASPACAAGSVVSYKRQPHRTTITIVDFENHHRGLVAQNKGQGKVRDARISDVKQRLVDGVRVMQVSRAVDWTDGTTTHTIESRLIGPDKSFSLVSDSSRRDWTANNFEGFLRQLVTIASIRGP